MSKYGDFIKNVIKSMEINHGFVIEKIEVDKDHIHLLVSTKPNLSPSRLIKLIKQKTSYELWHTYENQLSNEFWKSKIFWNRSSFVSSVGIVDKEIIENYINNQGKKPYSSVSLKT